MTDRYLIAGLGNPGREYRDNRHNVGFHVIDHFAERYGLAFSKMQNDAFVASGTAAGRRVILAKPQTYMNRSGGPVSALQRFYKLPVEHILVIYDDLDLPTGTIRLRPEGGSGGHNGMKDVITRLNSREFPRLRVGIGRPPGRMEPTDYVLQSFSDDEQIVIAEAVGQAADAIETWLRDGVTLAMSRHNGPTDSDE